MSEVYRPAESLEPNQTPENQTEKTPENQTEKTPENQTEKTPENQTEKKIRGRPFQPGNPGRPPGSKNQTTRLIEQLVGDEGEKLTRKVIDLALAGNVKCLEMCLDRLLPRRNGRPVDFSMPEVTGTHDIVAAMAAITSAVTDGSLTAEEARELTRVFDNYIKVLETHDLAARLETLELQMRKRPET